MKLSTMTSAVAALATTTSLCAPAFAQDNVEATFGILFGPTVPFVVCGTTPMVEELADAGFDINVVHSAQLGSENQMAEQVSFGELEMAVITSSIFAAWMDDISVLEAYYLYDNVDQVMEVYETPTAQALLDELMQVANVRVIGSPWLYGTRNVFGNREIREPADFENVRMRVPETPVSIEGARSLGAQPTPVAYSELYVALQQGIVDVAEAPIPIIGLESFDEPADYVMMTKHLITAMPFVVSEDFWQSLDEDHQQALTDAATAASERVRDCVAEAEEETLAGWKEDGAVTVIDDLDIDAIREKSRAHFSSGLPYSETYVQLREDLE
ncbi:TRAP transporter substrate-binding protein DctP [Palleronia sp. LCG004]|uniref:TRAP transporter substrate-binding protein DctP n=1 Tax=Palleronia sp. LCG004 TaxID=3079304 RepID=UPI0029434344|nr:TRAP transporter substrate-binding protein DctP [Palleronia sp. LCG004]WOI57835.1 TRAP transporter substrate-binding protein DctP [Palleronia sp. LCG004]